MIAFAQPYLLWGLLGLPPLVLLAFWAETTRRRALMAFVGSLAGRLSNGGGRRRMRALLRIASLGFLILALADPRAGFKVEELTQRGVDVLFLVDVSRSMEAGDVRPSRLAKAKAEIRALVEGFEGDRMGLVVFAGVPDVLCPLTSDRGAFNMLLELVSPKLIPVPGTDLGAALGAGIQVLGGDDLKFKVLVLVTDGEDHEGQGREVARQAAAQGIRIHTVNVGGAGAPIPTGHGFKVDKEGKTIFSRPDPDGLAAIASVTGGGFYQASSLRLDLRPLLDEIRSMEDRDLHSQEVRNLEERYQIPLFLCLLCLLFELALEPQRPEGGRRLA
jgi:Ca-activated chloride channel family protein